MLDWLLCWHNLHQMKGIRNGRQDVQHLLVNIWKSFQKQSDEVKHNIYL